MWSLGSMVETSPWQDETGILLPTQREVSAPNDEIHSTNYHLYGPGARANRPSRRFLAILVLRCNSAASEENVYKPTGGIHHSAAADARDHRTT